ncbi:P-loop containing nucleoside triphosphate hydrolase protein [Hypoxylon trugodes]|uniref:P-loop containing nucleoside triphosphate hydrolase protein n=1 Tax=Hypoxylon trugodes TaxID=326681 RepID=UPI00218EC520|nr:P-loop containing nucleoside triphosphate hydrolase protein [Hypoxylon trugodes]KAI1391631.1 P-loop containing nucleoside triphosphate hydrolase protein [Hypoxylon trugodes]
MRIVLLIGLRTFRKPRTIFSLAINTAFIRKYRVARAFTPSSEQENIIKLSRVQNVVVSARPGAGKTATAEAIVAANPNKNIAVVTYSKRLQLETERRLKRYTTCDVFTFHGMAGKLFSTVAHTDTIIQNLRRKGERPIWNNKRYDIVILDEMQDCTDDLFWLSCSFILAVRRAIGGCTPKIVVLGDERQAIYDFRGADSRFLSLSPCIMSALSLSKWTPLPLSKSFRLSRETAGFVNDVFLGGEKYLTGTHDGPKPLYMCANLFEVDKLAEELVPLIRRYGPERTAILAPSIREGGRRGPLANFTNLLSEQYRIPVAVSISDEIPLDDQVISGKICVSTYHQFKGNERDLVIVYGADAGYFKHIGRNLADDRCPNTIFVALTRAIKQLVILHDCKEPPMPFTSVPKLKQAAEYINISDTKMKRQKRIGRPRKLDLTLPRGVMVSDMSRHVRDEVLTAIVDSHVNIMKLSPPLPEGQCINAPDKILTDPDKKLYEAVSDINGLVVVAAYEYAIRQKLVTLEFDDRDDIHIPGDKHDQITWLCRAACAYEARVSGYRSRQVQMENHKFDWLNPDLLHRAVQRLKEQLHTSGRLEFESKLEVNRFEVTDSQNKPQRTRIGGRADIIVYATDTESEGEDTGACLWEIKFVAKLSLLYVVQACTYAYLWAVKHGSPSLPRIMLFNIRDGEKWELSCPEGVAGARRVVEKVLRAKYTTAEELTTDEFVERCRGTMRDVERLWEK